MILICKAKQRKGKTTVAVAIVYWLCKSLKYLVAAALENMGRKVTDVNALGYHTSDIHSNIRIFNSDKTELKEYHYYDSPVKMRAFVKRMIDEKMQHVILLVDEIDSVFSHRFWQSKDQVETLLGLWKDEHYFNIIVGTCHVGRSVDVMIRECMAKELIVQIYKPDDTVDIYVINDRDRESYEANMNNARAVQRLFDSWE